MYFVFVASQRYFEAAGRNLWTGEAESQKDFEIHSRFQAGVFYSSIWALALNMIQLSFIRISRAELSLDASLPAQLESDGHSWLSTSSPMPMLQNNHIHVWYVGILNISRRYQSIQRSWWGMFKSCV